ncbi:MAG: hypothetical protein K9W43_08650 [Candidatus Thorarchaeota archaeon]|nr:hypothetical protein [Candidatus Thorarchaeota archaeon]
MKEPILTTLLDRSNITRPQLETLLIDLVVEDAAGTHLPYEQKAGLRRKTAKRKGVSRGAFNRTLQQARRNVMRSIYTMVLLAYLGLFDYSIFRPFEEISAKIADYRRVREVLAGKTKLSAEDVESYRTAERVVLDALDELASPLMLKSSSSKRKQGTTND